MPDPSPSLMFRLGVRRRVLRVRIRRLAGDLGVWPDTVTRWEYGPNSPRFTHVVAYAELVGLRVVLRHGRHILAEGLAIPGALPRLRKAAGLTQGELAPIVHVGKSGVAMFETRGCTRLASIEMYAAGLGLTVGLVELLADDPGTGKTAAGVAS